MPVGRRAVVTSSEGAKDSTSSEQSSSAKAGAAAGAKASEKAAEKAAERNAETSKRWVDDWVSVLAGDGSEIPSVSGWFGYVGQAPEPGRLRLYFDPHLLQCIEFDAKDVVHRVPAPPEFSALGGSFVWIDNEGWANARALWRQI
jgi:hypothetical protein